MRRRSKLVERWTGTYQGIDALLAWRDDHADTILAASETNLDLGAAGGLDFAELAEGLLAGRARMARKVDPARLALDEGQKIRAEDSSSLRTTG